MIKINQSYIRRNSKILDVGVGTGILLEKLYAKGYKCFGIDVARGTISRLKKDFSDKNLGIDVKVGDVVKIPHEDDKFNVIFAIELFEHLSTEDTKKGLLEIKRCLKPGGYVIVTTPYKENLNKSMVICPDCRAIFHRVQHMQSFDKQKIVRLLKKNGYRLISNRIISFQPFINKVYYKILGIKRVENRLFVIAQKLSK